MLAKQIEKPTRPDMRYNAELNKYDGAVLLPEKVDKSSFTKGAATLRATTQKWPTLS